MRHAPSSTILAIDPGLARVGYVLARLWTNGGAHEVEVFAAGRWAADLPESDEREGMSVAQDSFLRARAQGQRVREAMRAHGVTVLVVEELSHPRDAGSAAKVSAFWGALSIVVDEMGSHVEMIRPQDVRRALKLPPTKRTMTRVQKKRIVQEELERRYGVRELKLLLKHLTCAEDRSHPIDALATLTAALVLQFGEGIAIRIAA